MNTATRRRCFSIDNEVRKVGAIPTINCNCLQLKLIQGTRTGPRARMESEILRLQGL